MIHPTIRKTIFLIFSIFLSTQLKAQTVDIEIDVEDGFLKVPLSGIKVSLLKADGAVLIDSVKSISFVDGRGKLLREVYVATVKAEKQDYLVRAIRKGYGEVWHPLSIPAAPAESVALKLQMRKERKLGEVSVKATQIKMYHKGDTLVYNADAFKLPDGSMLDELIRQLPGVTMDDNGQIFVNGRKVDELLLGSRSFMRGNKKILMENLPYYTVKDLKVYERQTDKSQALGYDVEARRYVMDVNLKNEYKQGYIANVETAGGTENRWLGRGFLLGFTDRWRYSLLGNANNVNESRHIGEHGHWSPATMPQSLLTTRSVATDLDYQSKSQNMTNRFNADYTSSRTESEMRKRHEQFLEGSKPVSLTESRNRADNRRLKLTNHLVFKKPAYFNFDTDFDYEKRDNAGTSQFEQWDDSKTASMHTDQRGKGRTWTFSQQGGATYNINKEKKWHGGTGFYFRHSDDRSWLSSRYDTWQAATQTHDIRHNAGDVSNRQTNFLLNSDVTFTELLGKADLRITDSWQNYNHRRHDYLYHPDTLLLASELDMLEAITDRANSYDSHLHYWENTVGISLSQNGTYHIGNNHLVKVSYARWNVGLNVPVFHQRLNYRRGDIDTLMHDTQAFLTPNAGFRYMSQDGRRDLRVNASYTCSPAEMMNQISYRDDSQPLVVKEGNPNLKGTATTVANADYTQKEWDRNHQWHIGASFKYRHRFVAQSVTYNQVTGVYTYKPQNVSGAYWVTAKADMSANIGKKRFWSWQTNANAWYDHSIDHAMLAGETASHENAVNTTMLHDESYIQYNRGGLNVRATGAVRWRHSEGKMYDFKTLDAWDFNYGLSARYTFPRIKTSLSADGTIYSRRGYGSSGLNTDDFVLNASLSQPFWKGKLVARLESFDLLHQISSTQYNVNAQGRTETWFRSLPHYVMLHLVYHWNKSPKKL